MAPEVDSRRDRQVVHGAEICRWKGPLRDAPPAATAGMGDVVVEAFGCGLPNAYLAAMGGLEHQPLWINLEYLSAEAWVEGCHGLASRQAQLPLTRYFFFPGFSEHTGGVLRERSLLARRDAFRAQPAAQRALWRALGVAPPSPETLKVSLFCYPNAPLQPLLDAWESGGEAIFCVVPEGVASAQLDAWARSATAGPSTMLTRGLLGVVRVPFVSQDDYDRLLWACDVNFVRGEDSFLRAQWAGRPLVWQCYPQSHAAHLAKLDAFLARYNGGLAHTAAAASDEFARAWNADAICPLPWDAYARALPALRGHAPAWADALATQEDLASNLVKFAADRV